MATTTKTLYVINRAVIKPLIGSNITQNKGFVKSGNTVKLRAQVYKSFIHHVAENLSVGDTIPVGSFYINNVVTYDWSVLPFLFNNAQIVDEGGTDFYYAYFNKNNNVFSLENFVDNTSSICSLFEHDIITSLSLELPDSPTGTTATIKGITKEHVTYTAVNKLISSAFEPRGTTENINVNLVARSSFAPSYTGAVPLIGRIGYFNGRWTYSTTDDHYVDNSSLAPVYAYGYGFGNYII